jgi:membrane associated rhomboid family serine protease
MSKNYLFSPMDSDKIIMLFFLGLGHKLKNFPIITVLMVGLCCVYYIGFQNQDTVNRNIHNLINEKVNTVESIDLYHDYISSIGGEYKRGKIKKFLDKLHNSRRIVDKAQKKKVTYSLEVVKNITDYKFVEKNYKKYLRLLDSKSEDITSLKSYESYLLKEQSLKKKRIEFFKENNLLNYHSISLTNAIKAMFSHGNAMHLIGNMVFLLIFGIFVEQRLGRLVYGLSYLGLGGISLIAFSLSAGASSEIYTLGASANISAVMGVFFMAFMNFKMRAYVWYFFMGKTIWLSIKKYFLPLFILQDLIMSLVGNNGVAHLAHLYGFVFGMVFFALWRRRDYLPSGFRYPFEYKMWKEARGVSANNSNEFLNTGIEVFKYNPENWNVKADLRVHIYNNININRKIYKLEYQLLMTLVPDYIKTFKYSNERPYEFFKFLNIVGKSHLIEFLKPLSQSELIFVIDQALEFEQYSLAICFIYSYFVKYPKARKLAKLGKTLDSILDNYSDKQSIEKLIFKLGSRKTSKKFNIIVSKYFIQSESEGNPSWQKLAS